MPARSWKLALALIAVVSVPAAAQQRSAPRARGQGWSLLSHQTVGAGSTALSLQLGFPGLSFGLMYGLQDRLDLGGRLALSYAHEGIASRIQPEVKAEFGGRLKLFEGERVGLGLSFGLGFFATFLPAAPTAFGMTMPVGLVAGIPIGSALVANVGVELPMFVTFGAFGGLTVPILAGAGIEYFLDKSLMLSFNTRMGPALHAIAGRRNAELAVQAQLGLGLKL